MWASVVTGPTLPSAIYVFWKSNTIFLVAGGKGKRGDAGAAVQTGTAGLGFRFLERASACLTAKMRAAERRWRRERLKEAKGAFSKRSSRRRGRDECGRWDVGSKRTAIARLLRPIKAIESKVSE
jgi:hypothetical protein